MSTTPVEGSCPTFRSLRRLRRRATDGHPRDIEGSGRSLHRDVEEDIDDPRRGSTSRIHVDHFHRPGVVCSSLPTTLGARQSPPKGRLRNGLLEESACRRGVRDDVEDPRRPLPSKAHVQRSAVSVGSAAGRLTGTRGTLKARVEHSIVMSRRTSTIHFEDPLRGSTSITSIGWEWFVAAFQPPRVPVSRPRRGDCGTGCSRSRLAGVKEGGTSTIHVDHSHRRLGSSTPNQPHPPCAPCSL